MLREKSDSSSRRLIPFANTGELNETLVRTLDQAEARVIWLLVLSHVCVLFESDERDGGIFGHVVPHVKSDAKDGDRGLRERLEHLLDLDSPKVEIDIVMNPYPQLSKGVFVCVPEV